MRKFISIFLFAVSLFSQESDYVTVVGDSLIGKVVDGKNIREVIGNVVITQGDVVINCNRALQYLTDNEIELIGSVVVTQDTMKIRTEKAYYYGDEKIAVSDTSVFLNQPGMELQADRGKYFMDQKQAEFFGRVILEDSNSFTLKSEELYYFKELERLNASVNVEIIDSTSIIFADSLEHFREDQNSFAFGNVSVENFENNIVIFGDTLVNDNQKNYSKVTGRPLFMQIDTSNTGRLDTLFVGSKILESYSDSTNRFVAIDSVKIIRGEFASVNQKSIFYNDANRIETFKEEGETEQPIIWFEDSQLVGDSIYIHLNENRLEWINVKNKSIIISKNENYDWRYDQISGEEIKLYFNDSTIARTEIFSNVLSIYYLFEEGEPSGLVKSSAQRGKIIFEDGKVVDVRLYVSPISEYHPENLVKGVEREFTLPLFKLYGNRPVKTELIKFIRERDE